MPKTALFSEKTTAIEGVLIPASSLAQSKRIQSLLQQAQHHAAKIIMQANADAVLLRDSARSAGYQAGLMISIKSVAEYLDNNQSIYQSFCNKAHESVVANLRQALGKPEIFPQLLQEWIAETSPVDAISPLFVLIPETSHREKIGLLSFIQSIWKGAVIIEQHRENRFVVKYGNSLAEFSPEVWIAQQKIDTSFTQQLERDCESLSQQAKQQLLNELSKRLVKT
jgi:hypothetical protein